MFEFHSLRQACSRTHSPAQAGGVRKPLHLASLALGIAAKINVNVTPRGTDATGVVAVGGADLAILPVSEIVHAVGVDFAGNIAPGIQFVQVFSAAVVAGSGDIEDSKRLIEFLAPAHASDAIRNSGMELFATSRC